MLICNFTRYVLCGSALAQSCYSAHVTTGRFCSLGNIYHCCLTFECHSVFFQEYEKALKYAKAIQKVEPGNHQAKDLANYIEKKMKQGYLEFI